MRFARVLSIVAAVAVSGLAAVAAATGPETAAGGTPTFTKDVAPILYKSCIECHRATMFAPMSLTSYEDARPWARSIKKRVAERTMPPWGSDMPHGRFRNDPRLTDQEIETIVSWVDAGAPKGDLADMPKLPAMADGWTIGKPDAVYSMTEDFKIPAAGTIDYNYIRIPVNLPEDRWYTAVEIKPSARAYVHHIIAYTEPHSDQPPRRGSTFGPTNITGVSPNKPGLVFEPGIAKLLRAGHDVILEIHYTTNGAEATDRTQVGFVFAKEAPTKVHVTGLAVQPKFLIPRRRSERGGESRHRAQTGRGHDEPDAAHAQARQGHDLHGALRRRHVGSAPERAEIRLQLADHLRTGRAEAPAEGNQGRGRGALRQLAGQQIQSRPHEGREMGRPDVGRDDDRILGFGGRPPGGVPKGTIVKGHRAAAGHSKIEWSSAM